MTRNLTATALSLALLVAALAAQGAAFDVASIRRNPSLESGGSMFVKGGSFLATNTTARSLIGLAYGVPAARVLNAPGWAADERYRIDARAEGLATFEQALPMVLGLLRDRFKLSAKKETRELPVYLLQTARSDGAPGPRMRKTDRDCLNREAAAKAAAAAGPDALVCGIRTGTGRLTGGAMSVANLLGTVSAASGRPVIDQTGLDGLYDIDLEWAPTPDAAGLSIFTAVEEQLGLKLESGTAPLDVVVVERIERPTEN